MWMETIDKQWIRSTDINSVRIKAKEDFGTVPLIFMPMSGYLP